MKAIRHTGIVVSNLEKSIHFYGALLGLKIIKEMDECGSYIDKILNLKNASVKTIKMAADNGNLVELLYFKSHPKHIDYNREINDIGCSHVAFTVDDIDTEYAKLKEAGVSFISSPQYSPDKYARVAFCKDPDGTFIELVEVLRS